MPLSAVALRSSPPQTLPRDPTARHLLLEVPAVSPQQTNQEVFAHFDHNPHLTGLPVVEGDIPIGLINRNIFMDSFARPFHREVFSQKSCIAFMDKAPLVVEAGTGLQELSFRAVDGGSKTLADGFIVTDGGRYLGMGTGQDMVRAVARLQAEKNRQVMESIDYASVIQRSFLRPSREALRRTLPDHLLIWEPRDVVGGDYLYFSRQEQGFFAALCDCTGHGVPGAFMTLIMASFLEQSLTADNWNDPARLLSQVNRRGKLALGQIDHSHHETAAESETEHRSDDGMDAAFLAYDASQRKLIFAGAHQLLVLLPPGNAAAEVVDGDAAGVGYAATGLDQQWHNRERILEPGTLVCATSDGLLDQVGGSRRIAFGKRRLIALLAELRGILLAALGEWQGGEPRRDDLTVFAFRA